MLGISVEFISGVAHLDRQAYDEPGQVEWPPHPDRLFMALVASAYRSDPTSDELDALHWLESQPPPAVSASASQNRSTIRVYWPTNDKLRSGRNKGKLLASTCPDNARVSYVWNSEVTEQILNSLHSIASRMTCLGRSESMVSSWVHDDELPVSWIPDEQGALQMRVPYRGRLAELQSIYAAGERPQPAAWQGYSYNESHTVNQGEWSHLIPLELSKPLDLVNVCPLIEAMRKCLLASCIEPVPSWVSGHTADGDRLRASHLGLVPLSDVGHEHAQGNVYGVGLLVPKEVDAVTRTQTFAPLLEKLVWIDSRTSIGKVKSLRKTVLPEIWCRSSKTWGTVTPILLHRWPKQEHVDQLLLKAIEQAQLPIPECIEIRQSSPHRGGLGMELRNPPKRYRLHATIHWSTPIAGPVAIGAGRYKGLGFCKAIS